MIQHVGACYWGYNKPGCFIWAEVRDNGRVYVRQDFKFIHRTIADVASEIRVKTAALGMNPFLPVWADPAMFGKQTAEEFVSVEAPADVFARFGVPMIASGGDRQHGWQRIHDFLRLAPDGIPWLVIAPACKWLARTLPTLTQTKTDEDDCEGEEYAANALRFMLASRPSPGAVTSATVAPAEWTLGWFKSLDRRAQAASRGPLRRPA